MMKFRALARPQRTSRSLEGVGAPGPVQCVGTHFTLPQLRIGTQIFVPAKNLNGFIVPPHSSVC